MKKHKHLSVGSIADAVGRITEGQGDPEEAKKLLKEILYAIDTSRPADWPIEYHLLEYLRHALGKIVAGQDATEALGLKRRKGRPTTQTKRNVFIATDVRRLMIDGYSLFDAALSLKEKYGLHESRIQDIHAAHKDDAIVQLVLEKLMENDSKIE